MIPDCTLPELDFPPDCAGLYPADFCYPFGYLARPERLAEPEELEQHAAWLRPFLIRWKGEVIVDPNAPVPVRRLARGALDTTIPSAIRWLEWGETSKDPSMQAAFRAEDVVTEAALWSEAGAHENALAMIRSVPLPYQRTAAALEPLVRSLKSLCRYEDALVESERLIAAENITEYARTLHRIEKAELLLHLGRRTEAEALLDERRKVFETFWSYHGMRAALALADGKLELAQSFVMKAGRLDRYHAYKLLWNRHLAMLAGFIRRELLTEDNRPRLYERNKSVLRICHSIHGALVREAWTEAKTLAEAILPGDVTDWSCAEAVALALTGVGDWERLAAVLPALPGRKMESIGLVIVLARWMLRGKCDPSPVLAELDRQSHLRESMRREFAALLHWYAEKREGALPASAEVILADVAPKNWGPGTGRDHWVLFYEPERGLIRQKFFQDRSMHDPMGWTLREHFPVLEESVLTPAEAAGWLERLLEENIAERGSFIGYKWTIHWNGWMLPGHLRPGQQTPLLAEAVRLAGDDPNFYFHNGPASTWGLHSIFTDKLTWLLRLCFRGGQREKRPSDPFWAQWGEL